MKAELKLNSQVLYRGGEYRVFELPNVAPDVIRISNKTHSEDPWGDLAFPVNIKDVELVVKARSRTFKLNEYGLTFRDWLAASGHLDSRKTRKAWRIGEDPTDWRASLPRVEPPPIETYHYVGRGSVPDTVKVGDFIHDTMGSWILWRVMEVFEADSSLFLAVRVTGSKYSQPGDKRDLLFKDRHVVETDPQGFVRHFGLVADLDVPCDANSRW